ncbi:DNA-binding SARP family transcriptional activator [Devosia sp. 2618]
MYAIDGQTAQVSILTFGDCHVLSSGRLISPPFSFMRILAYVLLEGRGKPVMRRRIGDLIWSDNGSEQANADIRQAVSRIRRFQEDHHFQILSADNHMVWLNLDQNIYFDLAEFLDLVANPGPKAWVRMCEIYVGDLLASSRTAGEGFEEWLSYQRSELQYEFVTNISQAVLPTSGLTPQERHFCATRLLQVDPYHEGAQRALMYDAAANGQFTFLRQLYEEGSRKLRTELGIDPDDETVELYQRLISRAPAA